MMRSNVNGWEGWAMAAPANSSANVNADEQRRILDEWMFIRAR